MMTDNQFENLDPVEGEWEALDTATDYDDAELAAVCFNIVEWWTEDYDFEELLEEFDILPEQALLALVRTGEISEERLRDFLTSDA